MKSLNFVENLDNTRYDAAHFVLCILYLILATLSGVILVRLVMKKHVHQPWQKAFHPLMIIGSLIRAVYFGLAPFEMEHKVVLRNQIDILINLVPSYFFFSDYLILLFLWAEIYHNAYREESQPPTISKLRPSFIILNIAMYLILIGFFLVDFVIYPKIVLSVSWSHDKIEMAMFFFTASIYLLTSLGFVVYGVRIYFKFSRIRMNTKARSKILGKIQGITFLVVGCFIIRSGVVIFGTFYDLSSHWYFDLLYFLFLEIVPLTLMLGILHGDSIKKQRSHVTSEYKKITNTNYGNNYSTYSNNSGTTSTYNVNPLVNLRN